MAYDEALAERIRRMLANHDATQKAMFGGAAWMKGGHMFCGIHGDELVVRVGAEAWAEALRRPHARPMDLTGRSLSGFVFVARRGFESDDDLADWVMRGYKFAAGLPPKAPRSAKRAGAGAKPVGRAKPRGRRTR